MSMPSLSNAKWAAVAATAGCGIAAGCLTFVSAVDVRSFLAHVKKKDTDLIQRHFPIWWPNGRDLMVPVLLCGTAANIWAYSATKKTNFGCASVLLGMIGPYTGIVLGEDIETLRQSNDIEVGATTTRFCNLHHLRLVAAATAFGFALVGLAEV